jgi:hypothetical protein
VLKDQYFLKSIGHRFCGNKIPVPSLLRPKHDQQISIDILSKYGFHRPP